MWTAAAGDEQLANRKAQWANTANQCLTVICKHWRLSLVSTRRSAAFISGVWDCCQCAASRWGQTQRRHSSFQKHKKKKKCEKKWQWTFSSVQMLCLFLIIRQKNMQYYVQWSKFTARIIVKKKIPGTEASTVYLIRNSCECWEKYDWRKKSGSKNLTFKFNPAFGNISVCNMWRPCLSCSSENQNTESLSFLYIFKILDKILHRLWK